MVTVREIQAGDVHAGVEHPDKHVSIPTGWAKCADDLALAVGKVDLLENVLESNACRVCAARVCVYHFYSYCFFKSLYLCRFVC